MTVVVIVLTLVVMGLTAIVFGLLRAHARVLRALAAAGIDVDAADSAFRLRSPGTAADAADASAVPDARGLGVGPVDLVGTTLDGSPVQVAVSAPGTTLLAFLSSGCTTCRSFWERFARPGPVVPGGGRLVIVTADLDEESPARLAELAPSGHRLVCSSAAWRAYEVPGSPWFVLVDGEAGRIVGSGTATSWRQVRGLLADAVADAATRAAGTGRSRADEALRRAGIGPGHPSLYPTGPRTGGTPPGSDRPLTGTDEADRRSGGDSP